MVRLGMALTAAFVVLRTFNLYGDPVPWAPQRDAAHSVMSFFLLTKHPLSLLMTLATVGPALIWLGVVRADRPVWRALVTIGRVPMFFYLVHVPLIHAVALGFSLAWYSDATWRLTSPFDRPASMAPPAGWGFGLPGVYLWTIVVPAVLYPACQWYGTLKIPDALMRAELPLTRGVLVGTLFSEAA